MSDKDRKRQRMLPTPQGRLPNWVLVVVTGAVTAAAPITRSLI